MRSEDLVVTHTDKGLKDLVLGHDALQLSQSLGLTHSLVKSELLGEADGLGHSRIQKFLQTGEADLLKHLLLVTTLGTHVAGLELIQRGENVLCLRRQVSSRHGDSLG